MDQSKNSKLFQPSYLLLILKNLGFGVIFGALSFERGSNSVEGSNKEILQKFTLFEPFLAYFEGYWDEKYYIGVNFDAL